MAVSDEIRSKYASQHHNVKRIILINAIPFDIEIIVQFYRCLFIGYQKPRSGKEVNQTGRKGII